jgi:hypothetical protein
MKYLQLFENWLNEAETGKSEAKPFDPSKPYMALVVDITKEQLFVDETKTARVIDSLLSRAFDKTEKVSSSKILVQKFTAYDYRPASGGFYLKLSNRTQTEGQYRVFLAKTAANELGLSDMTSLKDPVYLVTLEDKQDWVDEKFKISIDAKTYLLFKDPEDEGKKEDFALNTKWQVVGGQTKDEAISCTLGQILALASTKLENSAMLKDSKAGTPQSIAQLLGYKIPENYTPGKGVETSKA